MPGKNTPSRRIDTYQYQDTPVDASVTPTSSSILGTTPQATVETPTNLTLGATYIVYSHLTPTAAQELSWQNADARTPEVYLIQWSRQSDFSNPVTISTPNTSVIVSGLPVNTTIFYRVAARYGGVQSAWSAGVSGLTANDTTPPASVSGVATSWSGKTGDLSITWTPPTSPNYRDTQIVIRAHAGGPVLRQATAVAGRFVWTRAMQLADTAGAFDTDVVIELTPRNTSNISGTTTTVSASIAAPATPTGLTASWNGGVCTISWTIDPNVDRYVLTIDGVAREVGYVNRFVYTLGQNASEHAGAPDPDLSLQLRAVNALNQQSAAASLSTVAPLPSQPTGLTTNWSSGADVAEADCVISWTLGPQDVVYRLTIDGVARDVGYQNRYVYTFDQNRAEHAGTPDPVLTISLVAIDPFGRASTAASLTATNTAPPALTAPSVTGFFSSARFTWAATTARDALRYDIEVRVNGASVGTFAVTDTTYTFETTQSGAVDARVRVVDRFGQASAWSSFSTQASLTNAAQFVQELRQGVTYRDSENTSASALAALKDSNLTSGGITYAASTAWRWIEADHNREIRHQTTTLATSAAVSVYIGTSLDGASWTWHHGGSVSGGVWVPAASTTSETTAQGGAVSMNGTVKIRLSAPVQARFIRIGMRNTSASYTIREFYPRSVVQADDIAGETLSAISANLGTITAGSISSVSIDAVTITGSTINGGTITGTTINGGTITGTTVQTATSGSRVVLNNSGLFTYNSANQIVAQITTTTNGEILVGSKLRLTPDTITFLQPDTSYTGINVIFPSGNFNLLFENAQFTDIAKLTYQSTNGLSSASIDFIQGKQTNTDTSLRLIVNDGLNLAKSSISLEKDGLSLSIEDYSSGPYTKYSGLGFDFVAGLKLFSSLSAAFQSNRIDFQNYNNFATFFSIFPLANTIQFFTNPIISSFANQYTALNFGGPVGQTRDIVLGTTSTNPTSPSYSPRWAFRLTSDTETGTATGSNFQLISYNNDGSSRHTLIDCRRSDGHIGFGGVPSVSAGAVGSIDVYGDVRVRGRIRAKTDWTEVTLASNWSQVTSDGEPAVAYRVHADNTVELRGCARLTSGTGLLIATLPTEARPSSLRRAAITVQPSGTAQIQGARLTILTNGEVHYAGPSLTANSNLVWLYCRYSLD